MVYGHATSGIRTLEFKCRLSFITPNYVVYIDLFLVDIISMTDGVDIIKCTQNRAFVITKYTQF